MGLTTEQVETLIIIERTTACISVIGTLLLISTFTFIKSFRTLSNTLIFYASFANLFADVAALIGGSALSRVHSPLCQFQGFLLEMFMQSDPMWSLAMAVNVYLVFFRRYDANRLKKLYWIYFLLCYGVPFIPAMFCLFYKTKKKGQMYGNATLWCWIDNEWAPVRIYSYYAPIWIAILVTFIIYIRVGIEIFQKRSQLRAMGAGDATGTQTTISADPSSEPAAAKHSIMSTDPNTEPFTGIRTTEIQVTHDPWKSGNLDSPAPIYAGIEKAPRKKQGNDVTISARNNFGTLSSRPGLYPRRPSSMDKVKWAYTKCALLFAMSILITWVPASVNRVYGLRYPTQPSYELSIASALVLPLQGFWNTVIYFTTSLAICRTVWADFRRGASTDRFRMRDIRSVSRTHKNKESDSTVELSHSRGSLGTEST